MLEDREREIESLNAELHRAIANRTSEISLALSCAAELETVELAPGQIVEGRCRIVGLIGRGGMGATRHSPSRAAPATSIGPSMSSVR